MLRHEEKKPGGLSDVLAFFEHGGACSAIGEASEQDAAPGASSVACQSLCVIGDRLLTDVVFGNLHGMMTIHTTPLTLEGDNKPAMVFRYVCQRPCCLPALSLQGVWCAGLS